MLVRDRMVKKEELLRIKKQNRIDVKKGRRVNKKLEDGPAEDAVKVQALDKDYKDVLSVSPLKHRVNYDLHINYECREESKSASRNKSALKSGSMTSPALG